MAAGDMIAMAALAWTWVIAKKTQTRLNNARRCLSCGGQNAGYIHDPGCTGSEQKR